MSRQAVEQMQNVQKEAIIGSLKKQLYELRDRQHQFIPLENQVGNIESKYEMLQDQKQRIQSQHKIKLEINRKNILELRQENDSVKMEIHRSNVQIEESLREIGALKRTCENKESQISALLANNQEMNGRNHELLEDNKNQNMKIKNYKEERNMLDGECQRISRNLQDSIEHLKDMEKDARTLQAANNKLNSILSVAEQDNSELIDEVRNRENIVNATLKKLESLNAEIDTLKDKTKKLEKDVAKSLEDYHSVSDNLDMMIGQNKEQAKRIKSSENQLRSIQNDLDSAILERDTLCNEHQSLSTDNKILNEQIDKVLMEIMETERKNKEMQKQLQNYMIIDQEARDLLDRREKTFGILTTVQQKLTRTADNIEHLR